MTKIFSPRIARSGAAITIRARTEDGLPIKVTNVVLMEFWSGVLVATTKDGQHYAVAA